MAMKDQEQQKPYFTILQGSGFYFNKILSRKSTEGESSHVYYYHRLGEGVPFKWEMQPGIPRINDPPSPAAIIPTPSPSPLMQSLSLSKQPCLCSPRSRSGLKSWLRKTMKKIKEHSVFFKSRKHVELSRSSSYVKLLSSSSCNDSNSSDDDVLGCDEVDNPPRCKPWNISSILVRATRDNLMN